MKNTCLARLDLSHNRLLEIPNGIYPTLKDLNLSFNCIQNQDRPNLLSSCLSLQVLDLGDNKLSMIPKEILELKTLKRLDIKNNDIASLPPELGLLECIQSILYTGNKIKMSSSLGTKKLLSLLREKLVLNNEETIEKPNQHSMNDLNGKQLTEIPVPDHPPVQLIANQNALSRIPFWLQTDLGAFIKTLELRKNKITEFPSIGMPLLQVRCTF